MSHTTELYFECHITIEPVFDERLDEFKNLCKLYGFHVADLLMQKRQADTPERSKYDTFATGRSKNFHDMQGRMNGLLSELFRFKFKIWRYKIENTLVDSRYSELKLYIDYETAPEKEKNPRPAV